MDSRADLINFEVTEEMGDPLELEQLDQVEEEKIDEAQSQEVSATSLLAPLEVKEIGNALKKAKKWKIIPAINGIGEIFEKYQTQSLTLEKLKKIELSKTKVLGYVEEIKGLIKPENGASKLDYYFSLLEKGLEEVAIPRQKMIAGNIRLVYYVAKMFRENFPNTSLDDLAHYGYFGLMRSIDKWDCERNFSTYSFHHIRQAIGRGMEYALQIIRLPVHMDAQIRKYNKTENDFFQQHGQRPGTEEMKQMLGVPKETLERIDGARHVTAYLSSGGIINEEGENENKLEKFYPDEKTEITIEMVFSKELRAKVDELLNCLTPKEKIVIEMRFGLNGPETTLEEIGDSMNLTRERIRQIEAKALRRLKPNALKKGVHKLLE